MAVEIDKTKCLACGGCVGVCPKLAMELRGGTTVVCDADRCVNCGICVRFCPVGALKLSKAVA